jgi:CheY-like chemotaxis protein
VVVVYTREAFLQEVDNARFDAIISDSNVPSFDGFAALALAREHCPGVPFLFCSGNASPLLKAKAMAFGASEWLSKDRLDELASVVGRLCMNPPA